MATTTTINKTAGTVLLAHQAVTHPATVVGSAQDVSTKLYATIFMLHTSVEVTANTNAGSFHVQASSVASGDEDWATVAQFTATVSTVDTEAFSGAEAAGQTTLAVASNTGFVAGDRLYLQDTTTIADSEWAMCARIVSTNQIDTVDGITNAKDSADVIWNDSDFFVCGLSLTGITRLRVIFHHEGAVGANVHIKATMVTGDSYNNA